MDVMKKIQDISKDKKEAVIVDGDQDGEADVIIMNLDLLLEILKEEVDS